MTAPTDGPALTVDACAVDRPHTRWIFRIPIDDDHVAALQVGLHAAGFSAIVLREETGPDAGHAVRIFVKGDDLETMIRVTEWFAYRKYADKADGGAR